MGRKKGRFPSCETRARTSRGRCRGEGRDVDLWTRELAAAEGGGKWLVVEGRSIQPKVQNAASRAKIRTDGNINRSSFYSSSSLSLASFLRLPRFIRGCNLELGFYGARSNVLLSFPPLSFFLSSFFLRER